VSLPGLARTLVQLRAWRNGRGVFRLIVANSHALAETLAANDIAVGAVIGNGTRVVQARPPLREPPTAAYAGRLVPMKGVDDLLRAMELVRREVPEARLLIAGDGPDRARIERLRAASPVRDAVTMLGHVERPRLDDLLGIAWVQVLPSRYREPFANATAEAMMRGTAVVATATGGTPEVVRDGATGFLVPPGNPEALAARLVQVLRRRELAESLGAAARAAALAELTTARMVDRFEEAYRRMVA
jgi:glycosyltransferase involved in cell wall biosynthesis